MPHRVLDRFVAMHGPGIQEQLARAPGPRWAPVGISQRQALVQEYPWLDDDDIPGCPLPPTPRERVRVEGHPRPGAADDSSSDVEEAPVAAIAEEVELVAAGPAEVAEGEPVPDEGDAIDELVAIWHG